jgi:hypothetical protein
MSRVGDDQQVIVRHFLRHPHLISVDDNNKLFLCAYKEPIHNLVGMHAHGNFDIAGLNSTLALVHCNNRITDQYYARYIQIYGVTIVYIYCTLMCLSCAIHRY